MKVLLLGAYGQDNLGDEALLEAHLQQLSGHDVTVASSDPTDTTARYGVPSVPTYGAATLRMLRRVDHVVFGGGSVLKELPPPHARRRLLVGIAGAAALRGSRVSLSAVGVERIRTRLGLRLARYAADRCGLVTVRDEGSRRMLKDLGVRREPRVVADAAFLLEPGPARGLATPSGPLVILNPMRSGEVECPRERVVASFAALARHAQREHGARVVAMPFKTSGMDEDASIAADLGVPVLPRIRPSDALAALAEADLFVGMRHHGVLLALHAGTPALAVPYAPKTQRLVEELGLARHAIPASGLTPDRLTRAFDRAMDERRETMRAVEKPLQAQRDRARDNFDLLRAHLAGGP
ncbi:MAG TPA: polysaccharide pyruvyl transferase family protein [Candidatus Thermoplasmatota archaeon]|nr:polysaccharide pyruvyl transferase family protein [Candidatus Thermoplasmatota archaeon]